ncbi:MAG: peptide chain release factor 2, partial [Candidatus Moranbacteria bacterium]|nr:peptide chain release factor 2 [Candidatus Moranbacteria bacterium]
KKDLENWKSLGKYLSDLEDYSQEVDSDDLGVQEMVLEEFATLKKKLEEFEKKTFFSGKYDEDNVILEIHAGAGGDDAQDWAGMLLRMYLRFCEKQKWKTNILNKTDGSVAGIKSVVVEIKGEKVFGNLKSEKGVHRLVRQSPFNSDSLRQTSFAAVEIWPILSNNKEVEIDSKDLKVDTFRASGAGGQSVNTTDSAVRITHLPTKTVVTCQNERSQLKNKEAALKVLKARLYEYFEKQKKEKEKEIKGEYKSAEWGNQIRSYVLHPYKMVKDHRTGFEESDVEEIMNGNLDEFITEYLRKFARNTEAKI